LVRGQYVQQAKLVGSTGIMDFNEPLEGASVALSSDGSTAIIGGTFDNLNAGAAWIFTRQNGVWTQQGGKLTGSDAASKSTSIYQGSAVALSADGNTAIVGGMGDGGTQFVNPIGAVWAYVRRNGVWLQQGPKMVGSGAIPGAGGEQGFGVGADQGDSVALSADGNTAIVGGYGDNGDNGAVWVFTRDTNGVWTQQGPKLIGTGAAGSAYQGWSVGVSADGNTAVVGAPNDNCSTNSTCIGATWIFTRSGNLWSQSGGKLVGSGSAGGNPNQGWAVALSGDGNTAATAGPFDNGSQGAVWIFTRSGNGWQQQGGKLTATGAAGNAEIGLNNVSLSSDGNTLLVGAAEDGGETGAGFVFTRNASGVWSQSGGKLTGASEVGPARVGASAALSPDGSTAILGGPSDNNDMGAAWVFTRQPAGGPPSPGGASPASGSGSGQSMSFTFTDARGWQDLDVVNVLINNFLDGRNACYLAYSRSAGVLYLVGDDGGTLSQGLAPGGAGSVSNGQCAIMGAASSASGNGNTLTLTLNMSFNAAFAGNKIVYLAARDLEGGNSGWQALGTWNVPGANTFPSVSGANPARGSGASATLTFTFGDTKGFQDLGVVNVLINNFLDGRQACYVAYSQPFKVLYLVGDAGGGLSAGLTLGGSGSVSNSQCTVNAAGSEASGSGNTLTLTLNINFSAAFDGNRVIYAAARDAAEANNSGWQAVGSWTVQ